MVHSGKIKSIIVSTLMFSMNVSIANDYFYIVKKGDTLSKILYTKNLRPVYGKRGTLAEVLKLNPKLSLSGGNKIFPRMKIFLARVNTISQDIIMANSQQPTANSQQPTANSQQPTANSQQPTANSQQPTANSQQPTANSQQPTANSQQPTDLHLL